ncbi:MAG TPA: ATP-binding cassette domain-containing protein [Candidatus Limnocylindrales bacterium]|nr:ATP-binding cassette domain-containing protein [Candidatus Limnocylindrales bacterium]
MTPAVQLIDVSTAYAERPILRAVSLSVAPGELVAVVGRSGRGKTTLLRLVAGLLAVETGEVRVLGGAPLDAQRAKRIGFVVQDARLHPWRTVRANVALPLEVNPSAGVAADEPDDWLERLGLADAAGAYPHELSGGMRQRVALARALVLRPPLLLMDEPLASLDEITREELRLELLRLHSETGAAVLYVTHDLAEATFLADRVLVLDGRPARIVGEVAIDLPRPREPRLRRDPRYLDLVETVRERLG